MTGPPGAELYAELLLHPLVQADGPRARSIVHHAQVRGTSPDTLARRVYRPVLDAVNRLHQARLLSPCGRRKALLLLRELIEETYFTHRRERPTEAVRPRTPAVAPVVQAHTSHPSTDTLRHSPTTRPSQFVSISIVGGILTVRPKGPSLGERETAIIRHEIHDAMDYLGPRLRKLVLDLTEVHTVSSFALGMLAETRHRARALGAKSLLYGAPRRLAGLLRSIKLDRLTAGGPSARASPASGTGT